MGVDHYFTAADRTLGIAGWADLDTSSAAPDWFSIRSIQPRTILHGEKAQVSAYFGPIDGAYGHAAEDVRIHTSRCPLLRLLRCAMWSS